jgi:benzodiazapine receptor
LSIAHIRAPWLTAPAVLVLGIASGWVSGSAASDPWFAALAKPAFLPPGWVFPVAWTVLYLMIGAALGMVWERRSVGGGRAAIVVFVIQLALNLTWSPIFFRAHALAAALWVILAMVGLAGATTIAFLQVRRLAGLLTLPYFAWLVFATALNAAVLSLNPSVS